MEAAVLFSYYPLAISLFPTLGKGTAIIFINRQTAAFFSPAAFASSHLGGTCAEKLSFDVLGEVPWSKRSTNTTYLTFRNFEAPHRPYVPRSVHATCSRKFVKWSGVTEPERGSVYSPEHICIYARNWIFLVHVGALQREEEDAHAPLDSRRGRASVKRCDAARETREQFGAIIPHGGVNKKWVNKRGQTFQPTNVIQPAIRYPRNREAV